jgi:hypothetical protein
MADAAQADYFRTFLEHERSELDTLRAKDVKQLTECMTNGATRYVGAVRPQIRTTEDVIRAIDRMMAALDERFPDEEVRQRA